MKLVKIAYFFPIIFSVAKKGDKGNYALLPTAISNTACIHKTEEAMHETLLYKTTTSFREESDITNFSLMSETEKNYSVAFELEVCYSMQRIHGL